MKAILAVCLLLVEFDITHAQVAPAASAGKAELSYSLRYSELADFGGTLGDWHTITPSAALTYSSGHTRFPFNLEYAGGYAATLSGPSYSTGVFQHLLLSQDLHYRKWDLAISDDVGYRPQSPTTGFSGIPGIGEPIGSGTNLPPNQTILTINTHALENVSRGEFQHLLNYRMTLDMGASYDYLHYPDGNGLDTSSTSLRAGFDVRLNFKNSLTAIYTLSRFSYPSDKFNLTTNTVTFGFKRIWTRSLQIYASAGPEWVTNSKTAILPGSTGVSVQAGLDYQLKQTTAAISYSRGTSGGSGYMVGSRSDIVSASLAREFKRATSFELSGGYSHNSPFLRNGAVVSAYVGVQTSWRIGRNLNGFVNYTVSSQSTGTKLPSNVQDGLIHTISCGIGFTRKTRPSQ